jgi:hypothetical protein
MEECVHRFLHIEVTTNPEELCKLRKNLKHMVKIFIKFYSETRRQLYTPQLLMTEKGNLI